MSKTMKIIDIQRKEKETKKYRELASKPASSMTQESRKDFSWWLELS